MIQWKNLKWHTLGRLCFFSLLTAVVSSRDLSASPVEILPPLPTPGGQVIFRYDPSAEGALLKPVSELKGELLLMREDDLPLYMEVPMSRDGDRWQGSFSISDSGARVILLKFRSGERVDDNGGHVWNTLVHDRDGRELRGARELRAEMYRYGGFGEFRHEKDMAAAKRDLEKEIALYPANHRAIGVHWRMQLQENPDAGKRSAVVASALRFASDATEETALSVAIAGLVDAGREDLADSIAGPIIAAEPRGEVARSVRMREIFRVEDPGDRAAQFDKFLRTLPPGPRELESQQVTLTHLYLRAAMAAKADSVLGAMESPNVNLLNTTARRLSEQGKHLDRAETLSRRALEALRSTALTLKPSYMSPAAWETSRRSMLAMVLDTYATTLSRLGKHAEAERGFEEAYGLSDGRVPDITERLLESYLQTGKEDRARDMARQAVRAGNADENIVELYRRAYAAATGSETGFDAELEGAKAVAGAEMRSRLRRERLSTPAPEFALPSLDGSTVRLSDLRGKVVVVDFWATWCGPCRMSFPHLQAIYEAYRKNDRVMILAVNTWERVRGEQRVDLVREFMRDNKYSFPVLFDTDVVDRYRVEGIPTKFVIDRDGRIAFKSIGFTGGQRMEDEMTAQIEMLLPDVPAR